MSRRFDLPIYVTRKTLASVEKRSSSSKQKFNEIQTVLFRAGEDFDIKDLKVQTVPTPHDAVDAVAFVIEDGTHRVGILTDMGHVFSGLREVLASLDAVVIESNYDEALLEESRYPDFLKRRIRGSGGHLSNVDSARLLHHCDNRKLQWVCLCHLSGQNNCPETAIRVHQSWLGEDYPLHVAKRKGVGEMLELK